MEFTFLTPNNEVAFYRSDALSAIWTQEELSLECSFPFLTDKIIERGMVVLFQDPATAAWQAYEIRQCSTKIADGYQDFTAEDLAVAELTDCHVPEEMELTDIHADEAIAKIIRSANTVRPYTKWEVGTVDPHAESSGDISRGDVWSAFSTVVSNWNVYIMPRVTVNSNGIAKKYLDVVNPSGAWRGIRLSINKNMTDPCVQYDDTELYTALYGYGGTYTEDDETKTYTFKDVVWRKAGGHPAKPSGQTYLEWPEKTELYGRNGRPRFGYYQNTSITDPTTLLEKTWLTLITKSDPKISITGTVTDLYRLGYADEPLRLHDIAMIEIEPIGVVLEKQIIKLQVDLLDPTQNSPTIGDYIPNIIYITRDTEDSATGGGGGANGGKGSTVEDAEGNKYETQIINNQRNIALTAKKTDEHGNILSQAGLYIDPDTGVLIYAESNAGMLGSKLHVLSDRIETEVHDRTRMGTELSSRITQTANQIALEVSKRVEGDAALSGRITVEANRITAEVTRAQNAESALSGRITVEADRITAEVTRAQGAEETLSGRLTVTESAITQEVTDRTAADTTLSGRITTTANEITAEVTRATAAEGALSGRITVNADKVAIVVTTDAHGNYKANAAEIVAGINGQSGSYVRIKADTINLTGYVTATELSATQADIDNLKTGVTTATTLKAQNLYSTVSFYYKGHMTSAYQVTIGGVTYNLIGYR